MNTSVAAFGNRRSMAQMGARPRLKLGLVFPFFLVVLLTLMSIVYFKDVNRRLFMQSQTLQSTLQDEKVRQGQLLLEQSTLTAQARIESVAQNQLKMMIPVSAKVVVLSAPQSAQIAAA